MCITPHFAGGKLQQFKIPTAHDLDFADRGFPYIDCKSVCRELLLFLWSSHVHIKPTLIAFLCSLLW